jgi:hypothetical protein
VFVLLVCKATLWLHVLKQGVAATMNATQMKSVTLHLAVALLARNVKPFVIQAIVPERLIVLPRITGRPVPADIP